MMSFVTSNKNVERQRFPFSTDVFVRALYTIMMQAYLRFAKQLVFSFAF
jgi:hypothetical protein